MNKLHKQIDQLSHLVKRHQRFSYFSGIAAILTGLLWLANEAINLQLHLTDNYRVISWIMVALFAVIIGTLLTIYECQKKGRDIVSLSLISIIDRLVIISISTLVIMWTFFINDLILQIPSLLMLMYGILILASKHNLMKPIFYFGILNLVGGVIGLLLVQYSILTAAIVLGGGHIILGILLIINDRKNT